MTMFVLQSLLLLLLAFLLGWLLGRFLKDLLCPREAREHLRVSAAGASVAGGAAYVAADAQASADVVLEDSVDDSLERVRSEWDADSDQVSVSTEGSVDYDPDSSLLAETAAGVSKAGLVVEDAADTAATDVDMGEISSRGSDTIVVESGDLDGDAERLAGAVSDTDSVVGEVTVENDSSTEQLGVASTLAAATGAVGDAVSGDDDIGGVSARDSDTVVVESGDLGGDAERLAGAVSDTDSVVGEAAVENDASTDQLGVASTLAAATGAVGNAVSGVTGLADGDASTGAARAGMGFHGLTTDNLQIIEGIGPKMESILHENGIVSWADVAAQSPESLRAVLDRYGDKYRIIDPTSWIEEARLAAEGKVDDLIVLQKLDGVSKLEGMIGAALNAGFSKYKPDDLKIVEGIGPKIESLFKEAGIGTWEALAAATPVRLKEILDAAGPNFRLADPETWPVQADMAVKGEWDKLKEYQDILQGGKAG